jgi:negative regulator of sigma E activity
MDGLGGRQTVAAVQLMQSLRGDPRAGPWARAVTEGGLTASAVWLVLMGVPLVCVQCNLLPKPTAPTLKPPPLAASAPPAPS